jgi:hypothetical protein
VRTALNIRHQDSREGRSIRADELHRTAGWGRRLFSPAYRAAQRQVYRTAMDVMEREADDNQACRTMEKCVRELF